MTAKKKKERRLKIKRKRRRNIERYATTNVSESALDDEASSVVTDYSVDSFEILKGDKNWKLRGRRHPLMVKFRYYFRQSKKFLSTQFMKNLKFIFAYLSLSVTSFFIAFVIRYHFWSTGHISRLIAYTCINMYVLQKSMHVVMPKRYGVLKSSLRAQYAYIRDYQVLVEMTVLILIFSYTIRCFTETLMIHKARYLNDPQIFKYAMLGIIIASLMMTSNTPEYVSFSSLSIYLVVTAVTSDRVAMQASMISRMTSINAIFQIFIKEYSSLAFFFTGNVIFQSGHLIVMAQFIAYGFLCSITNFFFIFDIIATKHENGQHQVSSFLCIFALEIITVLFSPVPASFLIVPLLPQLTQNEIHWLMCSFFTSTAPFQNPYQMNLLPQAVIEGEGKISVPVKWLMCSLSAPIAVKNSNIIILGFAFRSSDFRTLPRGYSVLDLYNRKYFSYVFVMTFTMPCICFLISNVSSLLAFFLASIPYPVFELNSVLTILVWPLASLAAKDDFDGLELARLLAKQMLVGNGGIKDDLTRHLGVSLLTNCLDKQNDTVFHIAGEYITYILNFNYGASKHSETVLTLPRSMNTDALNAICYWCRTGFGVTHILIWCGLYIAFVPSQFIRIVNILPRVFMTSTCVLIVTSCIYFSSGNFKRNNFRCEVPNFDEKQVCQMMIASYNYTRKFNTLCSDLKGSVVGGQ